MPIIENYAERDFQFTHEKWDDATGKRVGGTRTLTFRKLTVENDDRGNGVEKPGTTEVSADDLKLMQADDVAKTWFSRKGLVVREGGPPAEKSKKAA